MKVCIQAGHVGRTSGATGAPEEMANNKRIADRLSTVLRKKKIEVVQTDAYGYKDPKVTAVNFDLFISLHCDMDYANDDGGGFADYANPQYDQATAESQRICRVINNIYFPEVDIDYIPRSNLNTSNYYMWKYLTASTPCVILEMGQSIDPHDKVLLGNTNLIANAIGMSICKALGVDWELPEPELPPVDPCIAKLTAKDEQINALITKTIRLEKKIKKLEGEIVPETPPNQDPTPDEQSDDDSANLFKQLIEKIKQLFIKK